MDNSHGFSTMTLKVIALNKIPSSQIIQRWICVTAYFDMCIVVHSTHPVLFRQFRNAADEYLCLTCTHRRTMFICLCFTHFNHLSVFVLSALLSSPSILSFSKLSFSLLCFSIHLFPFNSFHPSLSHPPPSNVTT